MKKSFQELIKENYYKRSFKGVKSGVEVLLETFDDFFIIINPEGLLIDWSKSVETLLGYSAECLKDRYVFDLVSLEEKSNTINYINQVMSGIETSIFMPVINKDGKLIPISIKAVKGKWNNKDVIFATAHNITSQKMVEEALERSRAVLKCMVFAAKKLLGAHNWENQIQEVLKEICLAARVSRAILFECQETSDGEWKVNHRYNWCNNSAYKDFNNTNYKDVSMMAIGFERWKHTLLKNDVLYGNVKTFPEKEKEIMLTNGVLSLIVIPIFMRENLWGFICFDECKFEREWSPLEIDAFKSASEILGSALQVKQYEKELLSAKDKAELANIQLEMAVNKANQIASEANSANNTKSEFLESIAHEIKTPVNTVKSVLNKVNSESSGRLTPEEKELLSIASSNTDNLLYMIDDIIDISNIDKGSLTLRFDIVNIYEYIDEIILGINTIQRKRNINIVKTYDKSLTTMLLDCKRFKQVMQKILYNAFRYTPEKETINIIVEKIQHKDIRFTVKDRGIGINEKQLDNVLKGIYRFDNLRNMFLGSSNIGLALTKRLVEIMGGEITIDSKLGEGTEIAFTLPYSKE